MRRLFAILVLLPAMCLADTSNNVGSGETYTTLSAWYAAIDDLTGVHTATLTSDISDNLSVTTSTVSQSLVIQSDGTRRTITDAGSGIGVIAISEGDLSAITIQDVNIDVNSGARDGFYLSAGSATVTIKRCLVYAAGNYGVEGFGSTGLACVIENSIFRDCGEGIRWIVTSAAATGTFTNVALDNNATCGLRIGGNANCTVNFRNSWSIGNGTDIIYGGTSSTANILYCVTSDASGTSGSADDTTGSVINKNSPASYFTNYANNDFTLVNDDNSLWGTNGDSVTTPPDDFTGAARSNDDIGPYDYVSGASADGAAAYYYLQQALR